MVTWRESYRPIIAEVIERVGTDDMKVLRKALRDAFPSPPRKYHPYKMWLDEVKVQLGTKKRPSDIPKAEKLTGSLFDV